VRSDPRPTQMAWPRRGRPKPLPRGRKRRLPTFPTHLTCVSMFSRVFGFAFGTRGDRTANAVLGVIPSGVSNPRSSAEDGELWSVGFASLPVVRSIFPGGTTPRNPPMPGLRRRVMGGPVETRGAWVGAGRFPVGGG